VTPRAVALFLMTWIAGVTPLFAQTGAFVEGAGELSPVSIGKANMTWQVAHAAAGVQQDGQFGWNASVDRQQRARLVDWSFGAGGFRRVGAWTLRGAGAFANQPDFLFRRSVEGELSRSVVGSLVLSGAYRHLEFRTASVHIAQPAVSWYFPRGDMELRSFIVRNTTSGAHATTMLLRGGVDTSPRIRLAGGVAIGSRIFDVAAIPNAEEDAWVAFGSARFTMSPQWAVELGIGGAREDPLFSQRTASVRVRRMF
jgi:YaiO family outer membrane protein